MSDADLRFYAGDVPIGKARFVEVLGPMLRPGMRILDVGAGRDPTIPLGARPAGVRYLGLDEEAAELELAADAYDEIIVGDITRHDPSLDERFDLIVSWQVFEHVRSPAAAYANIHRYLAPGGWYGGRLTGRHALFAVLNRLLPHRLTRHLLTRLVGRKPDSVFRAFYHDATLGRLRDIFGRWAHHEIWPDYDGREYFRFSWPTRVAYEQYLRLTRSHPALASYYTVLARKAGGAGDTR